MNLNIHNLHKYGPSIPVVIKRAMYYVWFLYLKIFFKKTPKESPIFILGNQKSGTTVISVLLAEASGKSLAVDFRHEIYKPSFHKVKNKKISFADFIKKNNYDFCKDIVKVPELTFFYEQLLKHIPKGKFLFIVRDPRDNIRSILNRLKIAGNLGQLSKEEFSKIPFIWQMVLDNSWAGLESSSYIESMAKRWKEAIKNIQKRPDRIITIKYEDFLKDKSATIYSLCEKLELEIKNKIEGKVDIQYQPKGDRKANWVSFYGEKNLTLINSVCKEYMNYYGYK